MYTLKVKVMMIVIIMTKKMMVNGGGGFGIVGDCSGGATAVSVRTVTS